MINSNLNLLTGWLFLNKKSKHKHTSADCHVNKKMQPNVHEWRPTSISSRYKHCLDYILIFKIYFPAIYVRKSSLLPSQRKSKKKRTFSPSKNPNNYNLYLNSNQYPCATTLHHHQNLPQFQFINSIICVNLLPCV